MNRREFGASLVGAAIGAAVACKADVGTIPPIPVEWKQSFGEPTYNHRGSVGEFAIRWNSRDDIAVEYRGKPMKLSAHNPEQRLFTLLDFDNGTLTTITLRVWAYGEQDSIDIVSAKQDTIGAPI